MGHYPTSSGGQAMSALAPKADSRRRDCHVRLVPIGGIDFLLDHLISEGEQPVWYIEAKGLGGLQVEHELELGGLYDR